MPDLRGTIDQSPMTVRQVLAVAMCVLLNAIDGFDVLSISFASPGIASEWNMDRAALGVVLSMELIGMAAGSVVLGQVADRIGRQKTVIACLVIMTAGMFTTTQVGGIGSLAATRLLTGLGIGGMLATTNAMVAEYSNDRWRGAAVAIMAAGYPLGGVVGGAIASHLLKTGDWREVFYLGAIATALCLPLVPLFAPEPVGSLLHRRPDRLLERINRSLRALGHSQIAEVPPPVSDAPKSSPRQLFRPGMTAVTVCLTAAFFLHVMTFYFILKWVPKIVTDMGFSPSSAGGVLVWANVGGLAGAVGFSLLSLRFSVRAILVAAMAASTVMVIIFGQERTDLAGLSIAAAAGGFFTNAGMVGLYALVAASYPTALRAGGIGFVIGFGRGGAALSPVVAGLMFQAGFGLALTATAMALGSLLAAAALLVLPRRDPAGV